MGGVRIGRSGAPRGAVPLRDPCLGCTLWLPICSKSMDSAKLRATGENTTSSSRVAASMTTCDASLRFRPRGDSCCFHFNCLSGPILSLKGVLCCTTLGEIRYRMLSIFRISIIRYSIEESALFNGFFRLGKLSIFEYLAKKLTCLTGRCYRFDKGAACQCNWSCYHYRDCCPTLTPPAVRDLLRQALRRRRRRRSSGARSNSTSRSGARSPRWCCPSPPPAITATPDPTDASAPTLRAMRRTPPGILKFSHPRPRRTPYQNGSWEGALHRVLFAKLSPATTYFYTCGQASRVLSFKSPPAPKHFPVTLGAVADLGSDCDTEGLWKRDHQGPRIRCDLWEHRLCPARRRHRLHVWRAADLGRVLVASGVFRLTGSVPSMPGNHEHYMNFTGYRWRFAMTPGRPGAGEDGPQGPVPVNNLFSSFKFGGVEFIGFSTEHAFEAGSRQFEWLSSALKASASDPSVSWRIVFAHRPAYCSSDYYDCKHAGPTKIRPVLLPLFEEYGVDFVFGGSSSQLRTQLSHLRKGRSAPDLIQFYSGASGGRWSAGEKGDRPYGDRKRRRQRRIDLQLGAATTVVGGVSERPLVGLGSRHMMRRTCWWKWSERRRRRG